MQAVHCWLPGWAVLKQWAVQVGEGQSSAAKMISFLAAAELFFDCWYFSFEKLVAISPFQVLKLMLLLLFFRRVQGPLSLVSLFLCAMEAARQSAVVKFITVFFIWQYEHVQKRSLHRQNKEVHKWVSLVLRLLFMFIDNCHFFWISMLILVLLNARVANLCCCMHALSRACVGSAPTALSACFFTCAWKEFAREI